MASRVGWTLAAVALCILLPSGTSAESPDSTYVSDASDGMLFKALFGVTAAQAQKVALGLGHHQSLVDENGAPRAATMEEVKAELKSRARAWYRQYAEKTRKAVTDTLTHPALPSMDL